MLNLRSLRDLPKVIAMLVIISCILVPGAFIVFWKTGTFHDESQRIEAEFLNQKQVELKERLQNVLALIRTKRTEMDTMGQAAIKGHVTYIHAVLSRMDAEWRTQMGDADLRRRLRQNVQAFDDNSRKGQIIVMDQTGGLVYPQPEQMPIREDIRQIQDENGDRLVDTIIPTVRRFDDVYRTFTVTRAGNGKTVSYMGYFRLYRPAGWIIGYVVDQADLQGALQGEILQILQNFRYRQTDYLITIGANGYILSHGTQTGLIGRNVLDVHNDQGDYVGKKIVEAAASGSDGGYYRYDWLNTETGQVEPKITYSVIIPGWNWTIATGVYLKPVYAQIAESRKLLKHRLITEFMINGTMWLLCLGGTWFFIVWARRKFSADVDTFISFFQQAAHPDKRINADELGMFEFKELAGYANKMVETRSRALTALQRQRQQMVTLTRAIEQSPVSVRVEPEKTVGNTVELLIDLQDNGPGIPADRVERLFKSFSQVDASTTRKHGGTGLGLLVAEDNLVNQKVAMLMLKKMGYRADVAANGREALEALKQVPYDLVLMDQQMPEMDGLEATRHIRASSDVINSRVPIIAMTANALKGDREHCLEAGMDDYLSKPVKPDQLKNKLDQWLVAGQEN